MTNELEAQLSRIGAGDHLCLLYETPGESLSAAAHFLKVGLDRGEHAFYVVDDHSEAQVVSALAAAGVAVDAERRSGRLRLLTAREYCPLETFDAQLMLARFRALGDELAARGAPAARAAVEMTWALTVGAPLDRLAEYECWGNNIFEHFTGASLCMYNQRRFPAAALDRLLRSHPIVVLDGEVAPNLFYEPPELFFAEEDRAARRYRWMLEQLGAARAARRERDALVAREEAEKAARLAAEEVSAAKSRFLAVLSHELRTPLTSVLGYTDLLSAPGAESVTPQQASYLERIRAGIWHLIAIIDQILSFARSEAGKDEVHEERFELRSAVRETVQMIEPIARAKCITLRLALPDSDVELHTDAQKLKQILINLLGNAVKFTDHGGVTVTVATNAGEVSVAVADTGAGIPEDRIDDICEPFSQLRAGAFDGGRAGAGSGLGLSVSRQLAALLGGELTVLSRVGEGSVFTLRLPYAPQLAVSMSHMAVPRPHATR
jgi:signal transduction histidine kinase